MNPPTLTELESRLASPDGEAVRDELAAGLGALASRLRADVAKGLSREDYGVWAAAIEAVSAAQEALELHPVATRDTASSPTPAPFPTPSHLR